MLEIRNLSVSIQDKLILDNLSLSVNAGEVAAIMGPNGSGKSTLAYVIAGKPGYEVTSGEIFLDGDNLLELEPNERALRGVFLAFQYPTEIPGVGAMTFLKAALNAQRRARGESDLTTPDFMRRVREAAQALEDRPGDAAAAAQCRLFRRREEAVRGAADGAARAARRRTRRNRFGPRYRRAQDRRRGRQRASQSDAGPSSSLRTINGCSTTSSRMSCT